MISGFERQWKKFTSTIESTLIRQAKVGVISTDIINKEIEDFFKQWMYDSSSNGIWYNNLKKQSEAIADEVIKATLQVRVDKIPFSRPSILPYYLVILIVGILSFLASTHFDIVWWKTILCTLAGIIIGATVIMPMGQQKISNYDKTIVAKYMQQITPHKQKIIDIISKL